MALLGGAEGAVHGADDLVPPRRLFGELRAARRRQPVVARAAVVLRRPPEGGDPAAILEAMERRVERSVLDLQHVFGSLRDGVSDGVAVRRPDRQRLEDEEIERTLK